MKKCLITLLTGAAVGGWMVQYDAGPSMIVMVEETYAQQRASVLAEDYRELYGGDHTLPGTWTQAPRSVVQCRAHGFTLFPAREAERCAQQYEAVGYVRAEEVHLEELAQRRAVVADTLPVEPALAQVEKAVAAKVGK